MRGMPQKFLLLHSQLCNRCYNCEFVHRRNHGGNVHWQDTYVHVASTLHPSQRRIPSVMWRESSPRLKEFVSQLSYNKIVQTKLVSCYPLRCIAHLPSILCQRHGGGGYRFDIGCIIRLASIVYQTSKGISGHIVRPASSVSCTC